MKRLKDYSSFIGLAILAILVVAGGLLLADQLKSKGLGASALTDNTLQALTTTSTTTASYCTTCPVKLLSRNDNRRYALIENVSDTAIYIYVPTTTLTYNLTGAFHGAGTSSGNATNTISSLNGILLNANGGSYEINPDNLIINEVWATSTAASKQINILYK